MRVQAWETPGTGLLVSERLVNCPPQLAPPLMRALFDEIQWATQDGASQVPALQVSGFRAYWCQGSGLLCVRFEGLVLDEIQWGH